MTAGTWLILMVIAGVLTLVWVALDELECAILGGFATILFGVVALLTWLAG